MVERLLFKTYSRIMFASCAQQTSVQDSSFSKCLRLPLLTFSETIQLFCLTWARICAESRAVNFKMTRESFQEIVQIIFHNFIARLIEKLSENFNLWFSFLIRVDDRQLINTTISENSECNCTCANIYD